MTSGTDLFSRLPHPFSPKTVHVVASLGTTASVVVVGGEAVVSLPKPAKPSNTCLGLAGCTGGRSATWLSGLLLLTTLFLVVQYRRA